MSEYIEILSTSSVESIDNCIICFYPLNYEIAELTCGHKFHFDCLKAWISNEKQKNIGNLCCICNKDDIEIKTIFNNQDSVYETMIDGDEYEYEIGVGNEYEIGVNDNEPVTLRDTDDPIDSILFCCTIL